MDEIEYSMDWAMRPQNISFIVLQSCSKAISIFLVILGVPDWLFT